MYLNSFLKIQIFFAVVALVLASCASESLVSQRLPLISHAHVGHALTAWRGTPNEQGLFVVAEQEIQIALGETNKALKENTSTTKIRDHATNVLHTLNPKSYANGPGLDYGAIRALSEATDHMLYAAQSKDASDNLVDMVNKFNDSQVFVANKMNLAQEISRLILESSVDEQQELLRHLQSTLYSVLDGDDKDQDGNIGNLPQEYGLLQLRKIISSGLRNEVPAYHPVGKKYLLGLIRLPNGNWAYKFDSTNRRRHVGYTPVKNS